MVRVRDQANELIASWRDRGHGDACEAFREHPELLSDRSVVLDLALEDFCLRRDRGEGLGPDKFRERFDLLGFDLARSIEQLVEMEELVERECLSRPEFSWPVVDEELAHLLVLEELGRGGLARVYLCQERTVGDRLVVAKLSARETEEAHRLGKLRHPCIVEVLSAQRSPCGEGSLICMPYYGRRTLWHLATWLGEQAPKSAGDAFASWVIDSNRATDEPNKRFLGCSRLQLLTEISSDIAMGLAYAHATDVVHGDIKPSNILLTSTRAKLIDFNLARHTTVDDRLLGGTLPYLAPETLVAYAVSGRSLDGSHAKAADIFALGITLAEVVSGVRPLAGGATSSADDLRAEVIYPSQLRLVERAKTCLPDGDSLARIIQDCTQQEPDKRPTAKELVSRLSQTLSRFEKRSWAVTTRVTRRVALASLVAAGTTFGWQRIWIDRFDPTTQFQRGIKALQAGRYDEAIELLSRTPSSASLHRNAQYSVAWALMLSGRFPEAMPILDDLATSQRDDLIEATIGYWYAAQYEFNTGLAAYERVEGEYRGALPTLNNHGCCLWLGASEGIELEQRNLGYSKLTKAKFSGSGSKVVRRNLGLLMTHDLLTRPHFVVERRANAAAEELLIEVPSREDLLVSARLYGAMASFGTRYVGESRRVLNRLLDLEASPTTETWETDPAFAPVQDDPRLDRMVRESSQRILVPDVGILPHPCFLPLDRPQLG